MNMNTYATTMYHYAAIGTQNVHGVQSPFFVRPLTQCLGSKIPVRRNSISTPTKSMRSQSTERCADNKENSDSIGPENLNRRNDVTETKKETDGTAHAELKISPIREEDAEQRELQSCSVESRASLRSRSSAYSSTNSVLQSYQPRSRSSLSNSASSRKSGDDNCDRYSAISATGTCLDFAGEDAKKENAITDAKYNFKCLTYEVPMPMKEDQEMNIETVKSNARVQSSPPLSVVFAQYNSPSLSRSLGSCTPISPIEASLDVSRFKCLKNSFSPGQDVSMIVQRSEDLSLSESFSTSSPFSTFAAVSQTPAKYLIDSETSMRVGNDDLLQDFYPNDVSFFCGVVSDSAKKVLEEKSPKSSQHLTDQIFSVDGKLFPENDEIFNRSVAYDSKLIENEKNRTYSTWESDTERNLNEIDPELSMLWETETDDLLSQCGSESEEIFEEFEGDKNLSVSVILKYLAVVVLTGLACGVTFIPAINIQTPIQPTKYTDFNLIEEFFSVPDIPLSISTIFTSDVTSTDISTYVRNGLFPVISDEIITTVENFNDAEIIWIEIKEMDNKAGNNEDIKERKMRKGRIHKESKEVMVIMQDFTTMGTDKEEEEEIIPDLIFLADDFINEKNYEIQKSGVGMNDYFSALSYNQVEGEKSDEIDVCAPTDVRRVHGIMEYYKVVECSVVAEEEASVGANEIVERMAAESSMEDFEEDFAVSPANPKEDEAVEGMFLENTPAGEIIPDEVDQNVNGGCDEEDAQIEVDTDIPEHNSETLTLLEESAHVVQVAGIPSDTMTSSLTQNEESSPEDNVQSEDHVEIFGQPLAKTNTAYPVVIAAQVSKDAQEVSLIEEEIITVNLSLEDFHVHETKSVAQSDFVKTRTYVPGEMFEKRTRPRFTPHSLLLLFGVLSTVSFFAILFALVSSPRSRIFPLTLMGESVVSCGVLLNVLEKMIHHDMGDVPIELDCFENIPEKVPAVDTNDFTEETVVEITPAVERYVKKERKISDKTNSVTERRVTRNTAKNLPEHSLEELSFPAANGRKSLRLRK